jgi:glucosyl-3-phosphoglycerate synthase
MTKPAGIDEVAGRLARHKAGRCVSVCLPARDEERTIGAIASSISRHLTGPGGLVDELLVIDHGSRDDTARAARRAGARVVDADGVLPGFGPALGKGDVLWRSLHASSGDIIVWVDADLESFTPQYVTRLVAPLLLDPGLSMVRATYERSLGAARAEGGRVTELMAGPALDLLRPDLAHIRQPLGGEYAIRRDVAESVPFEVDYGVEIGLLIDVADRYGVASIGQADLGLRAHRNRPLAELRAQSTQVLRTVLRHGGHLPECDSTPPRPPMSQARRVPSATGR